MGFFNQFTHAFKSLGKKIVSGAKYIGKKSLVGLDKTIQGLKYGTDLADKYTFGLDHFIPYYSAIKAGIDVSDHIRKMAKGEEKFNLATGLDIGLDLVSGAMSAVGGKAELEGLQGGYKMFKGARATGSGLKEATKIAGGRILRGYGLHKEQLRQMGQEGISGAVNIAKAVRKGDPVAIAKTAGGIGAVGGAIALKSKADEEGQEDTNPKPMVLPSRPQLPAPPPVIHPLIKPSLQNIKLPDIFFNKQGSLVDSSGTIYG
jgi:hypothetical protein